MFFWQKFFLVIWDMMENKENEMKILLPKELRLKMNQDGLKVCLRKCPELTFSFMNAFHFCTQSQSVTCPKSHTFTFLAPVGFVILHIG